MDRALYSMYNRDLCCVGSDEIRHSTDSFSETPIVQITLRGMVGFDPTLCETGWYSWILEGWCRKMHGNKQGKDSSDKLAIISRKPTRYTKRGWHFALWGNMGAIDTATNSDNTKKSRHTYWYTLPYIHMNEGIRFLVQCFFCTSLRIHWI